MAADTDPNTPRLTGEFLDRIRARLAARVNLGIDPDSPVFVDANDGSIYQDLEGPAALELDEFYDFVEVVVRAALPATSYGEWLDDWAESLGLERLDAAPAGGVLRFTGTAGTEVPALLQVTTEPVGDADPIAFAVIGGIVGEDGTVDVAAQAVESGSAGNVPPNTVTVMAVEIDGVTGVTNPSRMTTGADVETDERLSGRVRDALGGVFGAGTLDDYRRWALNYPGIGFVTVKRAARGPGTVDVSVTDLNNDPVAPAAVAGLQGRLTDADGLAPATHDTLVVTPDGFAIEIAGEVVHYAGFSLDSDGATIATRAAVEASVARYVNALRDGEEVTRSKVIAAFVDVRGVRDVTGLTINGVDDPSVPVADGSVAALDQPMTLTSSTTDDPEP